MTIRNDPFGLLYSYPEPQSFIHYPFIYSYFRYTQSINGTTPRPPCEHTNKSIVYIKVHKAASSLMNQILLGYGISQNKSLALPRKEHYFDFYKLFTRDMVFNYHKSGPKSELLINHARYNRREMEEVVPNAIYLASLRDPVAQFESCFGYFEVSKLITHQEYPTILALQTFLLNPKQFIKDITYGGYCLWNGQLFDLGVERSVFENRTAIKRRIKELDAEFDLILISEYLDESLILLKNLLCLDFTDILYLPSNVRSDKYKTDITGNITTQIRTWNSADVLLYEHFNRTLWEKIRNEGIQFHNDVHVFRQIKQQVFDECVISTDADVEQRLWKQTINSSNPVCKRLTVRTVDYVKNLRESMSSHMDQNDLRNRGHGKISKTKKERKIVYRQIKKVSNNSNDLKTQRMISKHRQRP